MTISDNGIGMVSTGTRKVGSFGLVGIQERISILGGTFSIESKEEAGTSVSVSVPLGPGRDTAIAIELEQDEKEHARFVCSVEDLS